MEGASACPLDNYDCLQDGNWSDQIQWSTSIAISRRTADVVYSHSNSSIVAVMNVSAPTPEIIAPSDVFVALNGIFGPDNSSNPAGQYATDPISTSTELVQILQTTFRATNTNPFANSALLVFRGILGALLLYFQIT